MNQKSSDADRRIELDSLKPLAELYAPGDGALVNPKDDAFLPLLMGVEEAITLFDTKTTPLTDAKVSLALDRLSMNPEEPSDDPLVQRIQHSLQLQLSVNRYTRQQVRQVVRKIGKSVGRHKNGTRGYLEFIRTYFKT